MRLLQARQGVAPRGRYVYLLTVLLADLHHICFRV